ncbi:MAG: hypothetical protein GX025_06510, partial [Clostridiales bacterium]|nr:hypothetical protein [Clostridiales bacterium]
GDGNAYKYIGEFKDGIFNGAGQRTFEDEQLNEYGAFKNGAFSPTPAEHFANLGQYNTAKYTITSKAYDFLSEHGKLFTTGFKSGLDEHLDSEFKHEAYTKSPDKYGDKLIFVPSLTITQMVEWESFGNQPVTYILASDSSYNIYYMHYLGTENVYVGDVINVYLLPLNHFTYESVSGNDIWAIACAVAYIEKA